MSTESTAGTESVADLSYEQARDELVAIVARIEGGSASLEESMTLWERGEALAAHCKARLDQAQEQLDRGATGGVDPGGVEGDGTHADGADADPSDDGVGHDGVGDEPGDA